MGLPEDLVFRTKGQLAIDILAEAFADGVRLDFVCGDEVYGSCTELREFLEDHDQAYVLRVPSSFRLTLPGGVTLTCKQAAARGWAGGAAGRSARPGRGSKGQRWYAWAWLATASARHHLLIRRHLRPANWPSTTAICPKGSQIIPVPAGPRSRAALVGRRRFRVRKGLLRARPVPGPPLHRDRPAHRAGHGRPGHLRRHHRPAPPPHRHPGTRPQRSTAKSGEAMCKGAVRSQIDIRKPARPGKPRHPPDPRTGSIQRGMARPRADPAR